MIPLHTYSFCGWKPFCPNSVLHCGMSSNLQISLIDNPLMSVLEPWGKCVGLHWCLVLYPSPAWCFQPSEGYACLCQRTHEGSLVKFRFTCQVPDNVRGQSISHSVSKLKLDVVKYLNWQHFSYRNPTIFLFSLLDDGQFGKDPRCTRHLPNLSLWCWCFCDPIPPLVSLASLPG